MKKYLLLPIIAAFAVSPALAETPSKGGVKGPDNARVEAEKMQKDGNLKMPSGSTQSPREEKTGDVGENNAARKEAEKMQKEGDLKMPSGSTQSPREEKTGDVGENKNARDGALKNQ